MESAASSSALDSSSLASPAKNLANKTSSGKKKPPRWRRNNKRRWGRKRETKVSAVEELVSVGPSEVLLSFMRCSLCKTTSTPDAYTCMKGHLVCLNCRPKVHVCPHFVHYTGKGGVKNTQPCSELYRQRTNPLYRVVYLQSTIPCDNPGCTVRVRGKAMAQHKRSCRFTTMITCNWPGTCSLKGIPFGEALDHFKGHGVQCVDHSTRLVTIHCDPKDVGQGSLVRMVMQFQKGTFALMTNSFGSTHYILFVNLCPIKEVKTNYMITLKVIGKNGVSLEYSGRVHTYGERAAVMNSSRCLIIGDQLMAEALAQETLKGDKVLLLHVFIQQLEKNAEAVVTWKTVEDKKEEWGMDLGGFLRGCLFEKDYLDDLLPSTFTAFQKLFN